MTETIEPVVLAQLQGHLLNLTLNRPRVLNTLSLAAIRKLHQSLEEALGDDRVRLILLSGSGERAFCAGGDLKELLWAVKAGAYHLTDEFFREEYALDLLVHQFPKAVAVLADGFTMGGGLGLAAGADLVAVTEKSRLAMPETRIGFFPDVGATGWLFHKCPPGYPEYMALTGREVAGIEAVRLGLATHLVPAARLAALREDLSEISPELPADKAGAAARVQACLDRFADQHIPRRPELDAWVAEHFAGRQSLMEIVASLQRCTPEQEDWCREVLRLLAERSPTALALTLKLLRANEGRPLPEVFEREVRACRFMIRQPDYLEGIRARLIDKDDNPRWQLPGLEALGDLEVEL